MKPKIVFLVMSAVSKPETVDQLARALAPHTVLVHHDFHQTPVFPLLASNVVLVPDPKRTGWGLFSFVEAVFHSMQYALDNLDFDYLQLLSPSCLPIKPIEKFEAHVSGPADAHFDCVDVLRDQDALMSIGYRALLPDKSFRFRLGRRLSNMYFGDSLGRREEAGIWLRSGDRKQPASWLALQLTKAIGQKAVAKHIFDENFRAYYGTTWFGARRHVIVDMVELFERPEIKEYFRHLCLPEEIVLPTLLMHLPLKKGPMNHCFQHYVQSHPRLFEEEDIDQLKVSSAFFARKFPNDPAAPVRTRVLGEMVSP
ncbi:MAG: beta-1,6-N-acetylglucosaminyltransferase [Rhodoferax sp.]